MSWGPSEDQDPAPFTAHIFFYVLVVHLALGDLLSEVPTLVSPDPQLFTNDNFGGSRLEIDLYGYLKKWTR